MHRPAPRAGRSGRGDPPRPHTRDRNAAPRPAARDRAQRAARRSADPAACPSSARLPPGRSLRRGQATVEREHLAGHERGGIGAEEEDRPDEVVGIGDPPQRNARHDALVERRVGEQALGLRGAHERRRDGIDRDRVLGPFGGVLAGERIERALGRHVRRVAGVDAELPAHGGEVEDAPAVAGGDHRRGPRPETGAASSGGSDRRSGPTPTRDSPRRCEAPCPHRRRSSSRGCPAVRSVPASRPLRGRHRPWRPCRRPRGAPRSPRLATARSAVGQPLARATDDRDLRADAGERLTGAQADATRTPGDDGHAAVQPEPLQLVHSASVRSLSADTRRIRLAPRRRF